MAGNEGIKARKRLLCDEDTGDGLEHPEQCRVWVFHVQSLSLQPCVSTGSRT